VGELSAINGIAGAYSESVKVIHIVGTTPGPARAGRKMIHHSLGEDPDHYVSFCFANCGGIKCYKLLMGVIGV
jgi:TPP-dependent 2-oxoacid decarboxylase